MRGIKLSLASAILLCSMSFAEGDVATATPEVDQTYWYAGGAGIYYRTYSIDKGWFDNGVATQDEIAGLTAIVGYNYNEYIAIEGRISGTIWEESYSDSINYGIYIKPYYSFNKDRTVEEEEDGFFSVYALLGFGIVKINGVDGEPPAHQEDFGKTILDDGGFQWGFGLSYTFVDRDDDESFEELHDGDITIYVEYLNLMNDGDINSRLYGYDPEYYSKLSQDSISVGITYRF